MAAKTTNCNPSGSSSFFFQANQQQHNPANIMNSKRLNNDENKESTNSDLHYKMAKKIAQLTKVIYALNTKNDEYENIIQYLKLQYEQEKEQLLLEINRKLNDYKNKFANESVKPQQIVNFESCMNDFQIQKERANEELKDFRLIHIQNAAEIKESLMKKMSDMQAKLNNIDLYYQEQIEHFKILVQKFDYEKLQLIQETKSKYFTEIQSLKSQHDDSRKQFENEMEDLKVSHKNELHNLNHQIKNLMENLDNIRLQNDEELKSLKERYENKMELVKNDIKNNDSIINLMSNLRLENQNLCDQRDKLASEIRDYSNQIQQLNENIKDFSSEIEILKDSNMDLVHKNTELRLNFNDISSKYESASNDNQSFKDKFEYLNKQLIDKTNELSKYEASAMQKSSIINDLKHELSNVRERLVELEHEKRQMELTVKSSNNNNNQQIKQLENMLNELETEKNGVIDGLKDTISKLKLEHKVEIDKFINDIKTINEQMSLDYELKLDNEKVFLDEKILTLEMNLTREFKVENEKLQKERDNLKDELNRLINEYKTDSTYHTTEISSYKLDLDKLRIELDEMNSKLVSVNSINVNLKEQVTTLNSQKELNENQISKFKNDISLLNTQIQQNKTNHDFELKLNIESITTQLNNKWNDILIKEKDKLKGEIAKQKENEFESNAKRMLDAKDEQIKNIKKTWQDKTNELLHEVSDLKHRLVDRERDFNEEISRVKLELIKENETLKEELMSIRNEHKKSIDTINSKKSEELKYLIDEINEEHDKKLNELKTRYLEDLKVQMGNQRNTMNNMKEALDKNKHLELELQAEAHSKAIEFLKNDLIQNHYMELDELRRMQEKELLTCKMELERALEINKLKERESQIKHENYQADLTIRQRHIDSLTNEIKELKHLIDDLKNDLKEKIQDIIQIKTDAQNELRNKEISMERIRQEQYNDLNVEHIRQKQVLVNEFKQAQELFKKRVSDLESALFEMDQRYKNRESREEDILTINNLNRAVLDREEIVKKIDTEKKHLQMELLNRETNFNKIFNTTQTIGTIDPLHIKSKSRSNSNSTGKSSPNARLEPLHHGPSTSSSQLHDFALNPNRILPKKFVT